jgi:hypothetical protein
MNGAGRGGAGRVELTLFPKRVRSPAIAELAMRGLQMAFLAFDFPGHGAGRARASLRSTKTAAKTTLEV